MEDIYKLAEKANDICESRNLDARYWVQELNGEERYFICNNVTNMENIDEVSKKEFISRIEILIKNN